MFDAELRVVSCRIFGQLHADEVGFHVAVDDEVKCGDRRIVLHIPRAELQSVAAFAELGQLESHRSRGVAADVELEMVVEVVGLLRFAVDNECQVVANAAARDVDAVAIVERCHEHWRGVHTVARPKGGGVEVASGGGSDAIGGGYRRTAYGELLRLPIHREPLAVVGGEKGDETLPVAVANVAWNSKGKSKFSGANAVRSCENHRLTVGVLKGSVGLCGVV